MTRSLRRLGALALARAGALFGATSSWQFWSGPQRPRIVCLCGSTRFKSAFEDANRSETLAGRVVLSVGVFGHHEKAPLEDEIKTCLDSLHFKKIEIADEILVININGYIGESTRREVAYAQRRGKGVRYFVEPSVACVVDYRLPRTVAKAQAEPAPA